MSGFVNEHFIAFAPVIKGNWTFHISVYKRQTIQVIVNHKYDLRFQVETFTTEAEAVQFINSFDEYEGLEDGNSDF